MNWWEGLKNTIDMQWGDGGGEKNFRRNQRDQKKASCQSSKKGRTVLLHVSRPHADT